ncbi:MAG: metallophosphoesterase family protein [Chloroflexota bacterium]|nr:metallophosphoesterase family protein [Chloroflexota bacterium]
MRHGIVADIHSNLAAFQAVLDDMEARGGVDGIWCLGDIVGYGPDPSECIALLRQYAHLSVAGNHDWASIGKVDVSDFNPDAAAACRWTAGQLTEEEVAYLEGLPLTVRRGEFTIVHGSPREPIWEYVVSARTALASFDSFDTNYCLIGHSHMPLVFEYIGGTCVLQPLPEELRLADNRLIINPGAVGQPRDGDPSASYAVYDEDEMAVYHYRVAYDVEATQERMLRQGLPEFLVARLSYGR